MDIEKTIEFLLNEQAKTDAMIRETNAMIRKTDAMRRDYEERWKANEERWKENDKRWARTDRRFNAISKLMMTGMKALREQNERINMLIAAQQRTEEALQRYFDRRGEPNGH
jgi:hypothetical protein